MVNGSLRCLGSSQHLKLRYGDGYEIDIKIKFADVAAMAPLASMLTDAGLIKMDEIHLDEKDSKHQPTDDAVASNYSRIRLTANLSEVCIVLSESDRINLIVPNGEGGTIYDMKHTDGFVNLHSFLEWWIAQDDSVRLDTFMSKYFPGSILLERSTAHSFRYRIPTKSMPLASVFRHFEEAKVRLNIEDYSVGQTTLEQIFNQFAASQDNPEVEKPPQQSEFSAGAASDGVSLKRTNSSPTL
jgi:hypothetical protein